MPVKVKETAGALLCASALIGHYETLHVKVDVSALTSSQVDDNGYLKPNVVLTLDGVAPTTSDAVAQVEDATVAGTITADGTVIVTVTSALLDGGSKAIPVTVANEDTAAEVAGKIRTALGADTDITNLFTVGGTTTGVKLTAKVADANDSTLNIALDNGTATGLTAAPTSTNTTAGVSGTTSEVPCVTVESVKVADDNSTSLSTAPDVFVACAVNGTLNRDVMEDVLERSLTDAEVKALRGPNSRFTLTIVNHA